MSTPESFRKKRVFVVDDDSNIADTLALILSGAGFMVHTFYDGVSALKHAQQETPDVVVSDVMMPKMDGIALAAKLVGLHPKCRVLLISGRTGISELLPDWQKNGGPDLEILAKPVHPETVIRKLTAMFVTADDSCPTGVKQIESSPGRKIFVVDDEKQIADILSFVLQEAEFDVETFHDARSALLRARECLPDILVSDIDMPEMNGVALAEALQEQNPNCKVILVSGNPNWTLRALRDGRLDDVTLIPKPFPLKQLVRIVSDINDRMLIAGDSKW